MRIEFSTKPVSLSGPRLLKTSQVTFSGIQTRGWPAAFLLGALSVFPSPRVSLAQDVPQRMAFADAQQEEALSEDLKVRIKAHQRLLETLVQTLENPAVTVKDKTAALAAALEASAKIMQPKFPRQVTGAEKDQMDHWDGQERIDYTIRENTLFLKAVAPEAKKLMAYATAASLSPKPDQQALGSSLFNFLCLLHLNFIGSHAEKASLWGVSDCLKTVTQDTQPYTVQKIKVLKDLLSLTNIVATDDNNLPWVLSNDALSNSKACVEQVLKACDKRLNQTSGGISVEERQQLYGLLNTLWPKSLQPMMLSTTSHLTPSLKGAYHRSILEISLHVVQHADLSQENQVHLGWLYCALPVPDLVLDQAIVTKAQDQLRVASGHRVQAYRLLALVSPTQSVMDILMQGVTDEKPGTPEAEAVTSAFASQVVRSTLEHMNYRSQEGPECPLGDTFLLAMDDAQPSPEQPFVLVKPQPEKFTPAQNHFLRLMAERMAGVTAAQNPTKPGYRVKNALTVMVKVAEIANGMARSLSNESAFIVFRKHSGLQPPWRPERDRYTLDMKKQFMPTEVYTAAGAWLEQTLIPRILESLHQNMTLSPDKCAESMGDMMAARVQLAKMGYPGKDARRYDVTPPTFRSFINHLDWDADLHQQRASAFQQAVQADPQSHVDLPPEDWMRVMKLAVGLTEESVYTRNPNFSAQTAQKIKEVDARQKAHILEFLKQLRNASPYKEDVRLQQVLETQLVSVLKPSSSGRKPSLLGAVPFIQALPRNVVGMSSTVVTALGKDIDTFNTTLAEDANKLSSHQQTFRHLGESIPQLNALCDQFDPNFLLRLKTHWEESTEGQAMAVRRVGVDFLRALPAEMDISMKRDWMQRLFQRYALGPAGFDNAYWAQRLQERPACQWEQFPKDQPQDKAQP